MVLLEMVPTISIALAIVIPFAIGKILKIHFMDLCKIKHITAKKCILYLCLTSCLLVLASSCISLLNSKTNIFSTADIIMDIWLLYIYFDNKIREQKIKDE